MFGVPFVVKGIQERADEMFIVKTRYMNGDFYLNGTVWSSEKNRATRYETFDAARKGLEFARQFMKNNVYRAATVIEA